QVNGVFPGNAEPGRVLAVTIAHGNSLSLSRRVLRRVTMLLVASAVVVVRNLDRNRSADRDDLLAAQARPAAVPQVQLVEADPGQGEAPGGLGQGGYFHECLPGRI